METIGTFTPDNLYADIDGEKRRTVTVPAGTAVKRGDILGMDHKPVVSGGTVDGVALDDIAADAAVRVCVISANCSFNANALFTGDSTTPWDWEEQLLTRRNIYVRQPAP